MKKISVVLFAIIVFGTIGCQLATDEEKIVNIRVYGVVRDKISNALLPNCSIYISNSYIGENSDYIGKTDSNGYYEFRKDVWQDYSTDISAFYDVAYKVQYIEINNDKDNEVNFFLEKY